MHGDYIDYPSHALIDPNSSKSTVFYQSIYLSVCVSITCAFIRHNGYFNSIDKSRIWVIRRIWWCRINSSRWRWRRRRKKTRISKIILRRGIFEAKKALIRLRVQK